MELVLSSQSNTQVAVICDGQPSHTFDPRPLAITKTDDNLPPELQAPVKYGQAIYAALFPTGTLAHQTLSEGPERILLVVDDADPLTSSRHSLQAVPWEYAYGDDFVVLDCPFVRGLPAGQRIAPPALDTGLHVVAVPSNPLDKGIVPLNIDGEWLRLQEIVQAVPQTLTLERTRPPTLEQLRRLLSNQRQRVLHFMGHGEQHEGETALLFENEHGGLAPIMARDLLRRVKGTVFLVMLNACVSATPGPTEFDNLAAALVRQGTPYALGMRFSVTDDDARTFSRVFYSELARGVDMEGAVYQARLALDGSKRRWAVGVPVLYTALDAPAPGFAPVEGVPRVLEHQPKLEISALPRVEGTFQGRVEELKSLGEQLTGDRRPRLLTIHGGGGQGKTALAREAVERFARAWPGGVWAISLENLPSKALFVADLARFLGVPTGEIGDPTEVERQLLARIGHRRTLLVLDNAETLIEQVEANNEAALELAQFIRQNLPGPRVSLLATSRYHLSWAGEINLELGGLASDDGARLFRQSAPQRWVEAGGPSAGILSAKVGGHPLSLRLLGGAFNTIDLSLEAFIEQYEQALIKAKDKWLELDHRHRTLYASIETSARYLDDALRDLLSGLWIFHAPFLPETAAAVFDPESDQSLIPNQLYALWRRGLLVRDARTLRDGEWLLYRLPPVLRPYTERHLPQAHECEALRARFGAVCAGLAGFIYDELDRSAVAAYVAQQAREDLGRGVACVQGDAQGYYLLHWGWVLKWLGDTWQALRLTERAMESAQGQDRRLVLEAMNNMALVYDTTGQPGRALELYQEALPIDREAGDRAREATTLNNMAAVYDATGKLGQALELYQEALSIRREVGDRAGEATTLTNMAVVYDATGQPKRALELHQEALPIMREMGDWAGEATTLNNMAAVYDATGQPKRALELLEEALSIMREVGDRAGEATTLNNMAAVYNATGQPGRALELYQEALPIRREVGDRAGEATTLTNLGMVYDATGQPKQALELYQEALPIRREVGDRAGEATTLNNMAAVYNTTGQPKRALELYQEALPIMREVGDRAGEATMLNNLGMVYDATGQPGRALELCQDALPIRREVGDRAGEAATLNNMAGVYYSMGQPGRALELYQDALPIMREVRDRAGEATTLNNLGMVYDATGQSGRALELYQEALFIRHEVGDRAGEATTLNNMAALYDATGQPKRALELYQEALPIMCEVGDRAGEATTLNNMAGVYRATGQPKRALELLEEALPIIREVENQVGEATTLTNLGIVYDATGQPGRALKLYQEALPIRREEGDWAGEASTLNSMAAVYDATGQPGRALELYQEALPIWRKVGDRAGEASTLNNMAAVYYSTGQPGRALELYQDALPIRRKVGDQVGEVTTLNNMAAVYYSTGQPGRALELYQEVLPIRREVGDRAGEASTLNNVGAVYRATGQPGRALELYQEALPIMHEVGNRAGEATTLHNIALVYFQQGEPERAAEMLNRGIQIYRQVGAVTAEAAIMRSLAVVLHDALGQTDKAIELVSRSISILRQHNLPQDASGASLAQHQELLARMRGGDGPSRLLVRIKRKFFGR